MSVSAGDVTYEFAGVVLDSAGGTLRAADGRPITLRPKAFELLLLFVQNHGRLLGRDAILRTIWPDVTISDDGVTQCVRDIRRALADDGQNVVRTVPGRGYVFVADVRVSRNSATDDPQMTGLANKPTIAVLPFTNLSGDPEQEYFSDGVVEEITNAIARLRWLFVIARNSSFTYKGKAVDVRQVGRELGVRYALEGSVRKAGHRVRIAGHLVDTSAGVQIWSDQIDGAVDDIFALQDHVASSVAGAIEPNLQRAEIERAHRKPTNSLDAYDLYLRALAAFRDPDIGQCTDAVELLQRALRLDPAYAPASGLLAHIRRHQHVMGVALSAETIADAVRAARHAVEAGRDDPDPLWMGGHTLSILAGDQASAMHAIERATALNPNCSPAWWAYASVNCFANHPEAAIDAAKRALQLSPLDPMAFRFRHMLAFGLMLAGRHQEGMDCIDRSLYDRPNYHPAIRVKIALCGYLNRREEGRDHIRRMLRANPAMTIAGFQALTALHQSPGTTAIFSEGLRRAGLPEA